MRVVVENHGPDEATLDVLPTLWFRNTWSWDDGRAPAADRARRRLAAASPSTRSPATGWMRRPGPTGWPRSRCSATTRPTCRGSSARPPSTAVPEGRHQRPRRLRRRHRQPRRRRHEGGAALPGHRRRRRARPSCGCGCTARRPSRARGDRTGRHRLRRGGRRPRGRRRRVLRRAGPRGHHRRGACGCCARRVPGWSGASRSTPTTWRRWLDGDPGQPPPAGSPARCATTPGGTSTPSTCWPCPTRGSTRGSPPGTSPSTRSPGRTSTRRSRSTRLLVLLREWFQHPNGALPAYEWNFDDVNPPVHVLAALRVFDIDGGRDREFLERVFQKLLINFTWWLNREDADGNNVFGGGFLGLDNISPIDRSHLPDGRHPRAGRRHGVDGVLRDVDARHRGRARRGEPRLRRHGREVPRAVPPDPARPGAPGALRRRGRLLLRPAGAPVRRLGRRCRCARSPA